MNNKLKIIFMGTPDFAVESLRAILKTPHQVVAVVTIPDKPSGRGRKLISSPIKEFAQINNIPTFQPEKLRNEQFVEQMKALTPDVIVVVAFRMLPKVVWQIPRIGTFNLHASILPQYRGAAPINWAIINGETRTGITTFFIDEKIDTGAILLQSHTEITPTETAGSLHDKLMKEGSKLVVQTLDKLAQGQYTPRTQKIEEPLLEAPKITKQTCRIDWNCPGIEIERLIRGLSPYPTAWTELSKNGQIIPIKIFNASFLAQKHSYSAGTPIVQNKELKIATNDGVINITELQIPGKKRMKTNDLLNGFSFNTTDMFH